jgi:50S ribosomal protein L16 3-hydroxylase
MSVPLGDLSTEEFLSDYWQKQPLLIRQAFTDFVPELDENDIAGLACDELTESRLVSGSFPAHDWSLRYGPFGEQDFTALPEENWTLLVQDVEKHYPPLQSLLKSFSFLPSWRIDDLMISVAVPGGSVGPHVDQYDVFLLQATGRRKWQIAESFDPGLLADCELNVLQSFVPEQEWLLEPGDLLYLPPGIAHHGVAVDQGMTWSVGMRAPSSADLLQALGEWLVARQDEGERYRDSGHFSALLEGEVDATAVDSFRRMVETASGDDSDFQAFLGSFLSRYRLAHEPAPPEQQLDLTSLHTALTRGARLNHNPWTRLLWLKAESGARLFAAGDEFNCSVNLAQAFCNNPVRLTADAETDSSIDSGVLRESMDLACELINKGHLYIQYPDE